MPELTQTGALDLAVQALLEISRLGRVCPGFELCTHPACSDSAAAAILALQALERLRILGVAPHE